MLSRVGAGCKPALTDHQFRGPALKLARIDRASAGKRSVAWPQNANMKFLCICGIPYAIKNILFPRTDFLAQIKRGNKCPR